MKKHQEPGRKNYFNSKKPLVSIILLNWNGSKETILCLRSLEKVSYKNIFIYIVDNGSEEEEIKKIELFKSSSFLKNKIEIIRNTKNEGFAEGNNIAIREVLQKDKLTKGLTLLLNNDTEVDKHFLEPLVSFLESNSSTAVVGPLIYNYPAYIGKFIQYTGYNINLKMGGMKVFNLLKKDHGQFNKPIKVESVSGCCWLIKNDILKDVKGFNKNYFIYCEETELAKRINLLGKEFFVIPSSKIWHKGSATTNKHTGFSVFLGTRNMFWLERKYSSKIEYSIFSIYFLFYQFPKNFLKFLSKRERKVLLKKYIKGIFEGVSKNLSEVY